MRDLIMGLANQPFAMSERFLVSLRAIRFSGEICLFVHDVNVETIAALRSHGVTVVNGRSFVRGGRHLFNSRFFMYLDHLSRHQGQYARVMLTDVRDVFFQSDPFAHMGDAEIVYARERVLIRDCPFNTEWIIRAYGEGVHANIGGFYASCAGTTMGTASGILRYLTTMIDEMTVARGLGGNIDQGIHNYIVHMKPLRGAVLDVRDRSMATLYYVPEKSLSVTDRGIEVDGWATPVIHQWERRDATRAYVAGGGRFRPAPSPPPSPPAAAPRPELANGDRSREAIVCWRGACSRNGLSVFFQNIRETAYDGPIVVFGNRFDANDADAARQHGCQLVQCDQRYAHLDPDIAAHLHLHDALFQLPADDLLLVLDAAAIFIGDPFAAKTIGVSLYSKGQRLRSADAPAGAAMDREPVATNILSGRRHDLSIFYAWMRADLSGDEMSPGALQRVFNRIAYTERDEPVMTVRPNGSVVYFPAPSGRMAVEIEPVMRVGGAAPAIIMPESAERKSAGAMV